MKEYYRTKLGILYYGDNKYLNYDNIDLIVTDPPYLQSWAGAGSVGKKYSYREKKMREMSNFNPKNFLDKIEKCFKYSVLNMYIWCSSKLLYDYIDFAKKKNYNYDILVWGKNNPIPSYNNSYMSDIEFCVFIREPGAYFSKEKNYNQYRKLMIDNVAKNEYNFPTQKYLWMIEKMIMVSSRPGNMILDPFCGTGTTAVACERLRRRWIAIEKE
jgi:site-specific DNA-methyltransferase (adenine-specific)